MKKRNEEMRHISSFLLAASLLISGCADFEGARRPRQVPIPLGDDGKPVLTTGRSYNEDERSANIDKFFRGDVIKCQSYLGQLLTYAEFDIQYRTTYIRISKITFNADLTQPDQIASAHGAVIKSGGQFQLAFNLTTLPVDGTASAYAIAGSDYLTIRDSLDGVSFSLGNRDIILSLNKPLPSANELKSVGADGVLNDIRVWTYLLADEKAAHGAGNGPSLFSSYMRPW
jgi:hypothetical protein